ncbi:DUF1684 domain-containing protein [Flavobacterium sp. '19STA2R22 D10 B1']|uniref:DUF1684 domain-containing protein n=1 Tax=Flavobacterium aerium TaxID=3037261 RepID=UPI00278BE0E8|nr:DUF1684 domain-containing protein [Flavobacterium sp. '19STA2R22 D10 B1']
MSKFLIALCLVLSLSACGQGQVKEKSSAQYQKELNEEYADRKKSPLKEEDFEHFKSLDFFAINDTYKVTAQFVRTADEKPFQMPTTTDRKPMYVKYGEAHFELEGQKFKLNIYQSLDLMKIKKYKDDLFLPFTDFTSGVESYGGGRYVDLKIPTGATITIDFNAAYNPYCAYNEKYSCPIPPAENDMKIEVKAGVKKFHE